MRTETAHTAGVIRREGNVTEPPLGLRPEHGTTRAHESHKCRSLFPYLGADDAAGLDAVGVDGPNPSTVRGRVLAGDGPIREAAYRESLTYIKARGLGGGMR